MKDGWTDFFPLDEGGEKNDPREKGEALAIGKSGSEKPREWGKKASKPEGGSILFAIGCHMQSSYPDPPHMGCYITSLNGWLQMGLLLNSAAVGLYF